MNRVQSLTFFSKYLSVIASSVVHNFGNHHRSHNCGMYHFDIKVNFEERLLPPKHFLSVASSEALIQRCSLMKYGTIGRFSFKIAVLNIFWKFLERHQ